jgi:uncharacterized protein YqjF (DUF2071 family)
MTYIEDILKHTENRNYSLPDRPWKYYQEWHDVLMLHYRVDQSYLEKLLPEGLHLDTFEGSSWVSFFSFSVKNLRPRLMPPLPYVSSFNEINLRTYVIKDGVPGIYMLIIEADKLVDVFIPRWFLGIPYVKATMQSSSGYFCPTNKTKSRGLEVEFKCKPPIGSKPPLDTWLTERHALYVKRNKRLFRFDIHHKEWKLQEAVIGVSVKITHQPLRAA